MLTLLETAAPAASELPAWAVGSITLGVLGLLGYVLKVTIPRIIVDFREESAANRTLFAEQIKAERDGGDKARQEWRELLVEAMKKGKE